MTVSLFRLLGYIPATGRIASKRIYHDRLDRRNEFFTAPALSLTTLFARTFICLTAGGIKK